MLGDPGFESRDPHSTSGWHEDTNTSMLDLDGWENFGIQSVWRKTDWRIDNQIRLSDFFVVVLKRAFAILTR
jgi:hypothetical protein